MSKKEELLKQAKKLKLDITQRNTIKEIEAVLKTAETKVEKSKVKESKVVKPKNDNKEKTSGITKETDKNTDQTDNKAEKVATAKAGKRSTKGIAEAEEKAIKEERKEHASETADTETVKPKIIIKRKPRIERAGKKFQEATKLVEKGKEYSTKDALELAIKTSTVKFDATVELHVRLGVDPKQADQNIREVVVLPEGSGKTVRVAVFGEPDDVAAAKKAGADIAGGDEFLQQLEKGVIDFDVLVSSPLVMKQLGKYARILGPKGLMPNPKSGTVTKDVAKAIKDAKAGKVEVRVDEAGIVHLGIGKVSFGSDRLYKNVQAIYASLKGAKPSSLKSNYVESIFITSSMGPSIKLPVSEI